MRLSDHAPSRPIPIQKTFFIILIVQQNALSLFHNNRTVTLDSEKPDILQQQYCSVFTIDNVIFPEYPRRVVGTVTLCTLVIVISYAQSVF